MASSGSRVSSGRDLSSVPEVGDTLGAIARLGFDFLCMPIFHPRFGREFCDEPAQSRPGAHTRSDLLLSGRDWNTLIVGKLSHWIQADSEVKTIRKNSEAALVQELNFAAYLGLPAFMIPLRQENNANLARILLNHIHTGHHSSMFWISVPLMAAEDVRDDIIENEPINRKDDGSEDERTWQWWHSFRTLCDYNKRICLAIEIGADLPSEAVIDKWLGEPIKAAILPTSIFLTNKKGFPVLSKLHQRIIFRLFKLDAQFIFTGSNRHSDKEFRSYLQYLQYLSENRPAPNSYEVFAKGYEDYLQSPLQVSTTLCPIEIGADLPSEAVIDKWLGEPIKAAILPTSIFLTNKKGFPVLSKLHQRIIFRLFKLDAQFIFTGSNRHSDKEFRSYLQYLQYLSENRPAPNSYEVFAKGYEDYLQSPLQPLMDNLESQTYEVFEKDPIKYSQYQQAVYRCLLDRVPDEQKDTNTQVLMVLGAGRGPLVNASLRAAKQAERRIRVYAVEKNPNAVITLENWRFEEWGDQVTVVSCDMREWAAPEKADIIVSELLGSFGDNELSPECLDGAQHFLKADGVSIPCDYTSYLAPISSSKLYNEVRMCREKDRDPEAQFEMPYVVRLHNFHQLAEPQACFTFRHPNPDPVIDNNRYCSLRFNVQCNTVLHGFAGYFETNLYKDVTLNAPWNKAHKVTMLLVEWAKKGEGEAEEDRATRSTLELSLGTALSKEDAAIPLRDDAGEPCPGGIDVVRSTELRDTRIRPQTHSPGMFSWFPILFPLKQPVLLARESEVCVRFWRCNNGKKVWYEWAVTEPVCSAIHNPAGRSYTIGL
ncbi:UNVERIFIED_CONTAM: hypothetical protein FKN15_044108 [Acipenser sinensis]